MLTWTFFYNYLFSERSGSLIRTIGRICVVSVGLSMASLIVVMSIMSGFNITIKNKLLLSKPHLVIQGPFNELEKSEKDLNSQQHEAYLVDRQDVVIRTVDGLFSGAVAKGIDTLPMNNFFHRLFQENRNKNANPLSVTLAADEVVIGLGLARSLDIYEGDQVVIIPPEALLAPAGELPYYAKAKVKAIIETDLQDVDNQLLFYPRKTGLMALHGSRSREVDLEVRLKDLKQLATVKTMLERKNLSVETWEDRDHALLFALKMEKIMISVFIGLSILVTSFSIITVLILLITQKRKDIAVLMAMGLSYRKTRILFTQIGLILASLGLGGGLLMGLMLSLWLDQASLDILPNIYQDTSIAVSIEPSLIIGAIIGGSALALLGSFLPVHFLLRFSPTQGLRSR